MKNVLSLEIQTLYAYESTAHSLCLGKFCDLTNTSPHDCERKKNKPVVTLAGQNAFKNGVHYRGPLLSSRFISDYFSSTCEV